MDQQRHVFANPDYVSSTEGILKLLELMFGGAVWGIMAINLVARMSGPFGFFMWASVTTWSVTLASYFFQLMRRPAIVRGRDGESPFKVVAISQEPRTGDLILNAFFSLVYIIGLVLFAVYAITYEQWNTSAAIMVIVMGFLTLIIHLFHASTLITRLVMGPEKWSREKAWLWEGVFKQSQKPKQKYKAPDGGNINTPVHSSNKLSSTNQATHGSSIISSGQTASAPEHHADVIYEDVPIEKGGYYNYNENNANKSTVGKEEDGAYLNPVFKNSSVNS